MTPFALLLACTLQFSGTSGGPLDSFAPVNLTWNPVPGASAYFVERAFGDFTGVYDSRNASITGTSWPVRHVVLSDTTVRYRVTAKNDSDPTFVPCAATATFTIKASPELVRIAQRTFIPVAGRSAGANGARFTTKLVLRGAPYPVLVCPFCPPPPPGAERAGRVVFHAAGRPASDSDPSVLYDVVDWQTQTFDDVLSDLRVDGIGWLEVVPIVGPPPAAEAWIFNTTEKGRVGARVAAVSGRDHLFTPAGAEAIMTDAAQRVSVGGLMLGNPGALGVSIRHANGAIDYLPRRDVAADTLIHVALGGLTPGDTVSVNVHANSVAAPSGEVAYVTVTDNATNDTTVIVTPANGVAATSVID